MSKLNDVILGRRIRTIRNKLKLDQKQFAERLDVTVSALSNWECGRNKPKEMFLEKIAELGNTTADIMLDREVVDYKQLYEQQKQRADELEKRWSELRERLNASFENSKYFLEGFGFSDVLKLMQQLEEDDNDA